MRVYKKEGIDIYAHKFLCHLKNKDESVLVRIEEGSAHVSLSIRPSISVRRLNVEKQANILLNEGVGVEVEDDATEAEFYHVESVEYDREHLETTSIEEEERNLIEWLFGFDMFRAEEELLQYSHEFTFQNPIGKFLP